VILQAPSPGESRVGGFDARKRDVPSSRPSQRRVALRAAFQQRTRAAYQDAILHAAERVFRALGYFDAKMADIARETGVSVGTLYHYFDNKEAVVLALAQREHDEFFGGIDQFCSVSDPVARLEALATFMLRFFEERGDLFAIYTKMGLSNENECRRLGGLVGVQGYLGLLGVLEEAMSEASKNGQLRVDWSPRQLAAALAGMLNSAIFLWMHDGRAGPLADRGKGVLDLFLKGARNS
jgi:AcrR family transcriptional regulator